jgi:hypothetical protein
LSILGDYIGGEVPWLHISEWMNLFGLEFLAIQIILKSPICISNIKQVGYI